MPTSTQSAQLSPVVAQQCRQLAMRQSMLADYKQCPQMALYSWVLAKTEASEAAPYMATILGSAGHKVVEEMHARRKFDMDEIEIMSIFEDAFWQELKQYDIHPNPSAGYDSIKEELHGKIPQYLLYLKGYQADDRNRNFISFLHEQTFALKVDSPFPDQPEPFIYTGTIDQIGCYSDGQFAERDLKFRDNAFKPKGIALKLNMQLTIYAYAAVFGDPVCDICRPRYEEDFSTGNFTLKYDGPCGDCQRLKLDKKWPGRYMDRVELVWMRDFEQWQEDKYPRERKATAKDKIPKIKDPKGTNRMVYPMITNEKWIDGPKKGDFKGKGILATVRTPSQLKVQMADVLRQSYAIRKGIFYRNPGDHCMAWCKHIDSCLKGLEVDANEIDVDAVTSFASDTF